MKHLTTSQHNKLQKIEAKAYKTAWSLKRVSPEDSMTLRKIQSKWLKFARSLELYSDYSSEITYINPNGEKRRYTFHDACC